jgi:hypothetical protein
MAIAVFYIRRIRRMFICTLFASFSCDPQRGRRSGPEIAQAVHDKSIKNSRKLALSRICLFTRGTITGTHNSWSASICLPKSKRPSLKQLQILFCRA